MSGHILAVFRHAIQTEYKRKTTHKKRPYDLEIKEAIKQQQKIGIDLMLRGFLAEGWMTVIEKVGASRSER